MNKLVRGSGGGGGGGDGKGGGGSGPKEIADDLRSKAFAQIIDVISEGEIEGLVNGKASIFVNETPLETAGGVSNFGLSIGGLMRGSQGQGYLPSNESVESEYLIRQEATVAVPWVKRFANPQVNAVKVRVSFPQLTLQNERTKFNVEGNNVEFRIELQSNGGGYQTVHRKIIAGKASSKYEKTYRVDLTGAPPWDIRFVRVSPDPQSQGDQNRTFVEAYTEVIDAKVAYPNTAYAAVKVDSSLFSSIPKRGYEIKGIKVRLPSNTTTNADGSLSYSGGWSGTFRIGWTSNPAWILYDLITSQRYGLGAFISDSQVDKWSFYSIGVYCDEQVSDGFGGLEPRFTANVYIQARQEALKVAQDIAAVFRGAVYWAGGSLMVTQDAPSDPVALFGPANVVDGLFNYQSTSAKKRRTVAVVAWNDPADFYRQKVEYVEDAAAIARFGIIEAQINAFGCTSRGQAARYGRWFLYVEQNENETVQFKTGLEGAALRPGNIIAVADPVRAGQRRAGRIQSATATTLNLDKPVSFSGSSVQVSVAMPDGTVEKRDVASLTDAVLTVTLPFTQIPQPEAVFLVESSELKPQTFRVISIAESQAGEYEVTGLVHNPSKYAAVEDGLQLETPTISTLSLSPDAPAPITITESLYEVQGTVKVKVTVSWNPVIRANGYRGEWTRDSQNAVVIPEQSSTEYEILDAEPGTYTFTLYAVGGSGKQSTSATATKTVVGKALPPESVQNFSLFPSNGTALLSWDKATDLDVLLGGSVRIRFSTDIIDPQWRDSVDVAPALAGSASRAQVPLMAGTYMAKFVDSSGNSSLVESKIITTVPAPLALNVVQTLNEAPTFTGVKSGMEYYAPLSGLIISATSLIDSIVDDIDTLPIFDFAGGVNSNGTYDFATTVDLTQVYSSRVTAKLGANAVDVTDSIDQRTQNCDEWLDLDGAFIDDVNAVLYVRTTEDNPAASPVWTPWKPFFVGDYNARGLQFQLRATSSSPTHNIVVDELQVTVDMPDRVIQLVGQNSSAAGVVTVPFAQPFADIPAIGITASNLASGDYFALTNKTRSGFDIVFRNTGGTAVVRNFDVVAKGYGRQLN